MLASRIFVTLAAIGAATVLVAPAAAASPAPPDPIAAGYGAGWLADQITANGGHLTSFGAVDLPDTAYAVVGLHAAGVGRAAGAQAVAYLKKNLGAPLRDSDGTDDPGRLGYVILAAVASGADPAHFGGRRRVNDLPARLLATARTTGTDAGLFGSGDPTYDGAFRQGVALSALAASKVPASTVRPELGWLERQQCGNGLWTSYRADPTTPCPTADPTTFAGPDTNSTGSAAQGLAAYRLRPHHARLVRSLEATRSADGGFPYLAAPGQTSDPDSTALSIQALLAEGADPGTAYAALATYQLGCSAAAADRGAFYYPGSSDPSVLATVQAVPAIAGRTLPVGSSTLARNVPTTACSPVAAGTAAPAAKARAGVPGACAGTSGVTVTVDFTSFSGREQTRCGTGPQSTGITAMQAAGFTPAGTAQYGLAFVCRIQGLPSASAQSCQNTPPASAYWALYTATSTATTWSYASTGASSYQPAVGTIEAWAFGAGAMPSRTPAQVRAATK